MEYNDFELFYMVNESEDALSLMIKKYEPLYKKLSYFFIRKFPNYGLDVEDLIQQCRITTCFVIDSYKVDNGVLFYSFLLVCLKRSLNNYIRRSFGKETYYYMDIENYENIEQFRYDDRSYAYIDDKEFIYKMIEFKNSLNNINSCIFELRFNGFSYKDIACLLDIKVKKVDNALLTIRKKLEKYFLF